MQEQVTQHISKRCQQRGVSVNDLEVALRYGRRTPWFHNAVLHYLGDRELMRALATDPTLRYSVDQLRGTALIVERGSERLLTVFREPRGIRQIAHNYNGLGRNRN